MYRPMIYNGVPNPIKFPPNTVNVYTGGMLLQWAPLHLNDFSIYTYGSPGTIELLGPSSLINSTLNLGNQGDNLINDGTMRLQHSQLIVDGSLAGYGSVFRGVEVGFLGRVCMNFAKRDIMAKRLTT